MPRLASPLRYPGGKSCLYSLVSQILRKNKLDRGHYVEPYAGGAGLALTLLFEGHVSDIHLNDVDRSVWSFWYSVLENSNEFIEKVQNTPVTVDEWYLQREVYLHCEDHDPLTLGFAAFFLNRTNRSGIIKGAGVIGGLSQTGTYKIDCRFNREDLIRRIKRIARYKSQIHIHKLDALAFIDHVDDSIPERSLLCIDPPYFKKGSSLYTSFYRAEDHMSVSKKVLTLQKPWILTYDNTPEIANLYKSRRQFSFDVSYSLQRKRIGSELLIASKGLKLPIEIRARQTNQPQYRGTKYSKPVGASIVEETVGELTEVYD